VKAGRAQEGEQKQAVDKDNMRKIVSRSKRERDVDDILSGREREEEAVVEDGDEERE
jgi:hypothetical protein